MLLAVSPCWHHAHTDVDGRGRPRVVARIRYRYKGVMVAGDHAVVDADGPSPAAFVRVLDAKGAQPVVRTMEGTAKCLWR